MLLRIISNINVYSIDIQKCEVSRNNAKLQTKWDPRVSHQPFLAVNISKENMLQIWS